MSAIGKTAYLLDAELEIPRLDTPRFAPLRGLIIDMATTRGVVAWSACRGVQLDAGGPGEPKLDVWIKKTAEAASDDYSKAGLRFRLDDASTSAGFSLDALRYKLGMTTVGTVGLDRVIIRAVSDTASEQAGVHVGPFYIATQDQDQFDVELLLYLSDQGTTWSFEPGRPAAASQPAVDAETEAEESDDDEEADEEEDKGEEDETWLAPLHNHQLKIAAVIYALSDGQANVGIAKADLVRPLEGMGVSASALEKARVNRYDCGYFAHNQERGADARLHLTGRGLTVLKRIYTSAEGDLETDALETMVQNVHAMAGRRSQKRAREAEAEVEAEVEAETEDAEEAEEDAEDASAVAAPAPAPAAAAAPSLVPDNSLEACATKLTQLLARFEQSDDETTNDRLAEGFSNAIGEFFKAQKRPPTTDESNAMLKDVRKALAQKVVLGSGKVTRQEVRQLLLNIEAAKSLPAAVAAVVARAE